MNSVGLLHLLTSQNVVANALETPTGEVFRDCHFLRDAHVQKHALLEVLGTEFNRVIGQRVLLPVVGGDARRGVVDAPRFGVVDVDSRLELLNRRSVYRLNRHLNRFLQGSEGRGVGDVSEK